MKRVTLDDHLASVAVIGIYGCWRLGTRKPGPRGYTQLIVGSKQPLAHREVYKRLIGPIPRGLTLDHLCRNRWCINPNHVEPVTRGVNTLRGDGPTAKNARKTCCPRGHRYTPENTLVTRDGFRQCRKCNRARRRRWYRRK